MDACTGEKWRRCCEYGDCVMMECAALGVSRFDIACGKCNLYARANKRQCRGGTTCVSVLLYRELEKENSTAIWYLYLIDSLTPAMPNIKQYGHHGSTLAEDNSGKARFWLKLKDIRHPREKIYRKLSRS